MLKKALKISLIISIFFVVVLAGAAFLTKTTKENIKKAETTVPDRVEYAKPEIITAESMYKKVAKKLKTKKPEVYSMKYQKMAKSIIDKFKKKRKYTLDSPLLIVNPYGTNTTGLYIYFKHKFRVNTKYTVSVKEIDGRENVKAGNFSNSLYTNTSGMPLAEQEGLIVGLIPGERNYVSVYIYDENNKMIAKAGYKVEIPESESVTMKTLEAVHEREISQMSEGLYTVFGLDDNGRKNRHILFYDNYGVIRAELPLVNGGEAPETNIGLIDDKLFYAIDKRRFALVDRMGKVEKFIGLEDGTVAFGDMDLNTGIRKAVTLSKRNGNDGISSLDILEGKSKEIVNFNKLFSSYYKKGGSKLKFTSVQFINDNDLIVSEKNTSSIIRINNVFRNPNIKAIISGTDELKAAYGKVFYSKDGDFVSQKRQSTAYIEKDEKLDNRQYHIMVFNNNTGGRNSFYYKYLVNEEKMTFSLENAVELPYSSDNGNIDVNNGYLVAAASDNGSFDEYNPDGYKLASFSFTNGKKAYRVFKHTMKGSWFTK
ncbi:MAG: aryl-sulfate sulfotransferase N-terminal domain-containing protein [Catonella sp.]|uniref:aryl-sulfate sulfotransferase N-terminal domain-containing protein n=1 Tax=Catonella sp. TaxID=2382125 RepID=UPI003FA14421